MADAPKGLYRYISLLLDEVSVRRSMQAAEAALTASGEDGGKSFMRELKQQFDRGMNDLRVKLGTGVIDKKRFQQEANELAATYNAKLGGALQKLRAEGKLTDDQFGTLAKRMKKVGDDGVEGSSRIEQGFRRLAAFLATGYLVKKAIDIGKALVGAAAEAEEPWNQLAGAMRSAGVSFESERGRLLALSREFQDTTTHDDEAYATTLARLIALTGDYTLSLSNVGLVANVAARYFKNDLAPAADLVASVLAGQTRGLREVKIYTKDVQEGYRILVERSMGAAADATRTAIGQTAQLTNQFSDLKEELGAAMIEGGKGASIMDTLREAVKGLTTWVRQNTPELRAMAQALASVASAAARAVSDLIRLRNPAGAEAGDNIEAIRRQAGFGNKAWMQARLRTEQNNETSLLARIAGLGDPEKDLQNFMAGGRGDQIPAWIAKSVDNLQELRDQAEAARKVIAFLQAELAGGGTAPAPPGQPPPPPPPGTPKAPKSKPFVFDAQRREMWQGLAKGTDYGISAVGASGQGGLIASAEMAQQKVALQSLTDYYRDKFSEIEGIASNAAMGWAGAWQDAFGILFQEGATLGKFMGTLGRGIAGALLGGLAEFASKKVQENIASAIEEVAKGLAASSNPFTAPMAAGHFAAAAQHGAAALAWGVLAGGAGAGQSAVAGGGRGGLSGGIPSGASDIGGRIAGNAQAGAPEVHIHLEGDFDALDPRVQKIVYVAGKEALEKFGAGANVILDPRRST